jgi:hypothetical protein
MATETFLRFGALYRQENTFLGGAFRAGQEWGCFLLECAPQNRTLTGIFASNGFSRAAEQRDEL